MFQNNVEQDKTYHNNCVTDCVYVCILIFVTNDHYLVILSSKYYSFTYIVSLEHL